MDDHEPITCHSPMMPVLPALPEGAGQGLGGSGGIGSGAISRRSPPPPPQQLGRSPFLGRSGRGLGMGSAGGLIGGASQDGLRGAGSNTGSPPPSAPVNATWGKGPSPGAPFSPSAHIGSRSPPSASAFPPVRWRCARVHEVVVPRCEARSSATDLHNAAGALGPIAHPGQHAIVSLDATCKHCVQANRFAATYALYRSPASRIQVPAVPAAGRSCLQSQVAHNRAHLAPQCGALARNAARGRRNCRGQRASV